MINKRFELDSEFIANLKLSQLRLMKDGELDWFILIPLKEDKVEIIDLERKDQVELLKEVEFISLLLREYVIPDKINVANIGNVVSQLHVHVLARFKNDRAWPSPIWGTLSSKELSAVRLEFWRKTVDMEYKKFLKNN